MTTAFVAGKMYSYTQLMAVYFGKLLEFIQIRTSVMAVESITVTMKYVDRETKEALEDQKQKALERINSLTEYQQLGIAIKYYGGQMPWKGLGVEI